MRDAQSVPFSYLQRVNKQWWRYRIPEIFPAYKPSDIDLMDADEILEHLAAIAEIEKREHEQKQRDDKYLAILLGRKV